VSLKHDSYGDGRTAGAMPGGDWLGAERNGGTAGGIPVPGTRIVVALAGEPPIAGLHIKGDLTWLLAPRAGEGQ